MFKYRVRKETLEPELGYVSSPFFSSQNDKELAEKLKTISDSTEISEIKRQVVEAWQRHKEELENTGLEEDEILPVVYAPFLVRIPLFDPKNPPEELLFLEVEYYPFSPLKKTIEKKIKKPLNVDINEKLILSKSKKRNRIVLKKYLAGEKGEKGKQISLFTTTNLGLTPYFEALVNLSERWKQGGK